MKHAQPVPRAMIQRELECGAFPDERMGKRLGRLLDQFAAGTAESVPCACQEWASTTAAYHFFGNYRVTEEDFVAGYFHSNRDRFVGVSGTMLVLRDTTQLSYRPESTGALHKPKHGPSDSWRHENPLCGVSLQVQPGDHAGGSAVGIGGGEISDAHGVQGYQRAEAEDQSHAGADRGE